jgi:hypothetical protein
MPIHIQGSNTLQVLTQIDHEHIQTVAKDAFTLIDIKLDQIDFAFHV